MDPYLEKPSFWPDVHHELISGIRAALKRQLRSRYSVRIEERVYVSGPADPGRGILAPDLYLVRRPKPGPRRSKAGGTAALGVSEPIIAVTLIDDEIHEAYLEVVDASDRSVVTVIEVLSPTNKVPGADGLESFLEKRNQIMKSSTHWVELDLLRSGVSPILPVIVPEHEYLIHVSAVDRRPRGMLWPIRLSQRLPVVRIPLRSEDGDTPLDLQAVLDSVYDRAGYDTEIDYKKEPVPRLGKKWKDWADRLLREKGLRPPAASG
jgi:hypothetical protein